MTDHRVFSLICENGFKGRESGSVFDLSQTVRKFVLQQGAVVRKAYVPV